MNPNDVYCSPEWNAKLLRCVKSWRWTRFRSFIQFVLILSLSIIFAMGLSALFYKFLGITGWFFDLTGFFCLVSAFIMCSCLMAISVFWPFLIYLYIMKRIQRRQSLAILIRNCLKAKVSLPVMIRMEAMTHYSPLYRRKLRKFAALLESGTEFNEAALLYHRLFPTEMIRFLKLQSDSPETIRLFDDHLTHEINNSKIYTFSISRFFYLFAIAWQFYLLTNFIVIFILGKYREIYADFDCTLPAMTQWFISFAKELMTGLPLLFLFIMAFVFVFLLLKTELLSWRPILMRRLFRSGDSAELLRFLSGGIQVDKTISSILLVYCQSKKSDYLRNRANNVRLDVDSGYVWTSMLYRYGYITYREVQLLNTAERTGNISEVLHDMAQSYEEKQLRFDDLMSKLLFVLAILMFGIIIGLFALVCFQPLVELVFYTGSLL